MTHKLQGGWNRGQSGFVVAADAQKRAIRLLDSTGTKDLTWQPEAPKYTEIYRMSGGGAKVTRDDYFSDLDAVLKRIEELERSFKDGKNRAMMELFEDMAELAECSEANGIKAQNMMETAKVYVKEVSALKSDVESMMLSTRKMMDKFEFEAAKLRKDGLPDSSLPAPKFSNRFAKYFGWPIT